MNLLSCLNIFDAILYKEIRKFLKYGILRMAYVYEVFI